MATVVPKNSFATEAEILAHVLKGETATSAQAEAIRQALVAALGRMDLSTGRKLRASSFRRPLLVAGCTVGSAGAITLPQAETLHVRDEVFGAATIVQVGAVLTAVGGGTVATMTPDGLTTGTVDLIFGWRPLTVDGYGDTTLILPQHPLIELWNVWTVNSDGTLEAVDLTAARIDYGGPGAGDLAVVELAAALPKGDANVIVECAAGIAAPSSTDPGGGEAFYDLQAALMQIVQVNWQRYLDQPGEYTDESMGTQTSGSRLLRMPDAVKEVLREYRRVV